MIAALKKLTLAWAASLLFAMWSGLCVVIGIVLGVSAAIAALEANGVRVTREIQQMIGGSQ